MLLLPCLLFLRRGGEENLAREQQQQYKYSLVWKVRKRRPGPPRNKSSILPWCHTTPLHHPSLSPSFSPDPTQQDLFRWEGEGKRRISQPGAGGQGGHTMRRRKMEILLLLQLQYYNKTCCCCCLRPILYERYSNYLIYLHFRKSVTLFYQGVFLLFFFTKFLYFLYLPCT